MVHLDDTKAIVHPTARLDGSVVLGEHAYVGANCFLNGVSGSIEIGRWSTLTRRIAMCGKVQLNGFDIIAPDVTFIGFDHNMQKASMNTRFFREHLHCRGGLNFKGKITIGYDVWIGMRAIVLGGHRIGNGAVIGAGSVVTRSVNPYEIVAGNPIRHLRYRFSKKTRQYFQEYKWWLLSDDELRAHKSFFNSEYE